MTDPAPTQTMAEHTVTTSRVLDAPREFVWRAWTDPEQFSRWWGPEGFSTPLDSVTIELREGGAFRATMVGTDGRRFPGDGYIKEIVEPERLVLAEEETDHPMIERVESTVTFTDLGDGRTELVIEAWMVCTEELVAMSQSGWSTALDKLGALLAQG